MVLGVLAALANPQRVRILASLVRGRNYVSQLARDVGLGRPLVHMHLRKLEAAGLIRGDFELSKDGKAMKFYEVVPFEVVLNPQLVSLVAGALPEAGLDAAPPGRAPGKE